MDNPFRKFLPSGVEEFCAYIRDDARGPVPLELLEDEQTSEPCPDILAPQKNTFHSRMELGVYLNCLLQNCDPSSIDHDIGLWSAFALTWFDLICPIDVDGIRSPAHLYRYVLSEDYRHYYRHLIRSPWQLVKDHGESSSFLLIAPQEHANPLSVHGEILEQLGGRQNLLRSKSIINAANHIYFDFDKRRPKTGVAGSGPGSARRFGLVLKQFDLTYDPDCMSQESLLQILPDEFKRWL